MTTLWLRLAAAATAALLLSSVGCTRPEMPWAGREPGPAAAPAAAPAGVDVTAAPAPANAAPAPVAAPADAGLAPTPSPAPAPLDEDQAFDLVMALPEIDAYRRAVEARGWHVAMWVVKETPTSFVVGIGESRDDRVAYLFYYLVRRADGAVEPWDIIHPPED